MTERTLIIPSANVAKVMPLWGKATGPLYVWAERGLIHCEYSTTNGYVAVTVDEMKPRIKALRDLIVNSSEDPRWQTERVALQNTIDALLRVVRQAQEQGMPDDPQAVRSMAARRKKSFSVAPRAFDKVVYGYGGDDIFG